MDWCLASGLPEELGALRREVSEYLQRHAEVGSDTADAALVVSEVVGNAMRHANGPIWVQLTWAEESPKLVVRDLGPGFPLPKQASPGLLDENGRGLFLVSHLAQELRIAARRGGGSTVTVALPVRRASSASYDPPATTFGALPRLEEAQPGGAFGRESFLRALVVQLSQAIERIHGPNAAEAAVAQVGIDVGGQMEQEFRLAREIVGRLDPDQLGECFVRLKHAIDGDFSVVEANSERIVLVNRRCPFGDVVRNAPALCRMTSSVFGGIAARNSDAESEGQANVVLEERIAVGDPGCRVVVYLGNAPESARRFAHRYSQPRPAERPVHNA
jgi:anti-sigma regulatory factor (Ser/Thr protein kinase)/predicted ArsR family transcriptional regulator